MSVLKIAANRRFEKFHEKCRNAARSKKSFDRSFIAETGHIVKRSGDQNSSIRMAIQHEHMAGIIIYGKLNAHCSNDNHPMEIALDGCFLNFKYVEFGNTKSISEVTVPKLYVRLVVRDKVAKLVIVTVYPNQETKDQNIPEVPYEIW